MRIYIRWILSFLLVCEANNVTAQSSPNYAVTNVTNGTLATDNLGNIINMSAASSLVPQGAGNYPTPVLPIGFDFIFMGKYYSNFVANTNGVVALGIYNSPISILPFDAANDLTRIVGYPPTNGGNASALGIFWDYIDAADIGPNLRTVMTGIAPNRCRVIEWNATINNSSQNPAATAKFQMRLYEGSGIIEYVYGNMSIGTGSNTVTASIGFTAGATDNQFLALQNLTSFNFTAVAAQEPATQNLVNSAAVGIIPGLHSIADGQRRVFKFTPPALSGTALNGVHVTETAATYVSLAWNDTYNNELGYNILVSTDNVNFISAGTTSPNATSFTVGNLTLGITYYFKVLAYTEGSSFASNTVNATTSCILNGTYTIGPGGTYATLGKAVDSIKVKGVAGNVIFELLGTYTSAGEVFPISFPSTAQIPCIGNYKVIVRPAVSATNLQITAPLTGPMILLNGVNYLTIDGRPGGTGVTGQLSIINGWLNAVLRLTNSSNNKFLYLNLRGGEYMPSLPDVEGVVVMQGTQGAGSDNNKFAFCDIHYDPNPAFPKEILFYSNAVGGSPNNNDSLVNCNFYDFFNSAVTLVGYNDGWVIQSNSFYNTGDFSNGLNATVLKIDADLSTTSHQVTQNFFGGTAPNCQGSEMDAGYRQTYYCIDIKGKAIVSNNYFRRIRFYNASSFSNTAVSLLMIRSNTYWEPNVIENNQFGWSSDIADSLHFSHNNIGGQLGPVEAQISCLTMLGSGPVRNNQFANIRCYAPYNRIWLKVINGSSQDFSIIRNNTIGNPSIPNSIINHSNWLSTGIYVSGNAANVIGNTICRMTATGSANLATLAGIEVTAQFVDSIAYNTIFHLRNGSGGVNNNQTLMGMRINPGTSSGLDNLIEGNHVYSIVQEATSGGGNISGIYAGIYMNVRKNLVHNLYTTSTSGVVTISGILMASNTGGLQNNMISLGSDSLGNHMTGGQIKIVGINGADNLRHNSVYIDGNNVANGTVGSMCFSNTINPSFSYNNIFFNARSNANASGGATHAGVSVGVSYIANHNLYYFTGTGGAIGIRSGTPFTTLATWQAASTVDANAIFSNPTFINPGGNSNVVNLHVNPGSPIDHAGTNANTLTDDFDNEIRSTLTPVDIGADAIAGAPGAPTVTSFTPTSGATGATITITGTNFTGAIAVSFGGTPAASFTVVNATTITAVVGSGSSGAVDVTTPAGTATRTGFIFIRPPVITSFTPTSAGTGATITISGTNFTNVTAVNFGGTAASSFIVVDTTTITAVVGTGASGNVSVTNPGGTATLAGFTFILSTPLPTITSFTPASGGAGASIAIIGTNFTGATAVSFGGVAASSFIVNSATSITAVVGTGASGNVSVTTPGGTATLAGFTFIPIPTITSFTPTSGPAGTSVTITGTNFTGTTAVSFGGIAATSFTVNSATSITAVLGIGATGNVSVTTPGGTATLAGFTFIPIPTITSFTPTSGTTGTSITVTGTNFTGAASVSFGGIAATSFTVNSATSITAIVGIGATGNVSVTTPGGTATLAGFTFIPIPTITSFTPTSGPAGTSVTITGTNFTGATAVSFGGVTATSFTVNSATSITAVVGIGATGNVSVTTPGGTATLAGFTFIPIPTITSFTPTSGPAGTSVTITGTNFTGATAVSFGGVTATSFTVNSATSITAVVGIGATGNVNVTTPGGTSSLAGFTFVPPPTVTAFTPTSGGTGTSITITGTNFTGATAVSFGGVAATSFTVNSATSITAVVGSGVSGNVSVTTPGGTATLPGFIFNTVTGISSPSVNSFELRIYPNPVIDMATIIHPSSNKNTQIRLIDITGKIVKVILPMRNTAQSQVDLKILPAGIYNLIWSDGSRILSRTLMIK